jgi:hypothetical protein
MRPDPMLLAETRAWFTRATNDLRAAEHEFSATPPLLGDIVFPCQQAALALAREVYEAILSRLPEAVRP